MTWHTNNSTPSTYSPGLAEAFSLTSYLDTIQSELVKSNPTQEMSYSQDKETDSCQPSRSGTTYARSTGDRGEDQLTFFAEDSPAKTSLLRVKEQELRESVRDYGRNMRDSLERCGLDLSLPKTHLCFALGDLELSSKTWPRWGIMLDGECSELGMSVRHINETECGSWPTPATRDYKGGHAPQSLTRKDGKSRMDILPNVVVYGGKTIQQMSELDQASCRKTLNLNPSWVEWLMGWPIEWTDLKPLATDRHRSVQPWHSLFS